jgi:hypothetical protein
MRVFSATTKKKESIWSIKWDLCTAVHNKYFQMTGETPPVLRYPTSTKKRRHGLYYRTDEGKARVRELIGVSGSSISISET